MAPVHHYSVKVQWTGNQGQGTSGYRSYSRDHTIVVQGKTEIQGSSDPAFRGDQAKHNPEDLFVASLSACHMLWFLHLCAEAGVVVTAYTDQAKGVMVEDAARGGYFSEVTLYPEVMVTEAGMKLQVDALHEQAHSKCFIANSCNFPVRHQPSCNVSGK